MTTLLRRLRAPWWIAVVVVSILLTIQLLVPGSGPLRDRPAVDPTDVGRTYRVERVIDGDTLLLKDGERVRLIGVDTPELSEPAEPLAGEASRFSARLVEGRSVRLAFDKERRDRYGRLLAYVFVDDVLLNEAILRAGYGTTLLQYPYSNAMKRIFQDAEADAKKARRGLWSSANSPSERTGDPGANLPRQRTRSTRSDRSSAPPPPS